MFENYGLVEHEAQKPEINLAPFVDTIMILLIFFVVTANLYVVTGVDVSKPKAQSARTVGQKAVMIGITREGTVHIYGRQVSLERLQNIMEQETAKMPDLSVLIIADKDAAIGKAVQVMDKCALAGAAKVSLAAEKD
jgi:biopolymer transport protein ExbD